MNLRISIIFCALVVRTLTVPCTTPNNEQAQCISLYSCPTLISALATQHSTSIDFVRRSNCGGTAQNPMVCCGTSSNFTVLSPETFLETGNSNVLSDKRICGLQHADEYYRSDNKTTVINAFTWLALLKYTNDDGTPMKLRCSGSLINTKYVLTSATCVHIHNLVLERVRLGGYHPDCIDESNFYECREHFEEFGIENITIHPNYVSEASFSTNIALIRLNRTVTYSDYIQPVCLTLPKVTYAKIGDALTATGWSSSSSARGMVDVKTKVQNKLISAEECSAAQEWTSEIQEKFLVDNNTICTTEVNKGYVCLDIGGGPVMFNYRNQWRLVAVSSYHFCGRTLPEQHTSVHNYVDWITENAKS